MNKICKSKTCSEKSPQLLDQFVKDERYKDGYQNRCKTCQKQYDQARFEKNRDKILTASKLYYSQNLDSARAKRANWRKGHMQYASDYGKLYRQLNPGKGLAKCRRYQTAKLSAAPDWLTQEQIKEMERIYMTCPKGYEVDHIVPLQGKDVRGLHVPWNLQHLPKSVNRKKSNKY